MAIHSIKPSAMHLQKLLKEGKSTQLTADRIEKLTEVGFVWKPRVSWEERFDELVEFKDEFGHCNVSQNYAANPALAKWVRTQRQITRKRRRMRPR